MHTHPVASTRRSAFRRASFGLLVLLPITASCGGGGKGGSLNFAAALTWRGYVDTDLGFDEFFFQDHTITAWFMPQHPNAYAGPLVTTRSGTGFFFGQGGFRSGVPSGNDWGAPNLLLRVGNDAVTYTLPSLTPGTWHHTAVVHTGTEFKVYLDSVVLCSDSKTRVGTCHLAGPVGGPSASEKVRIGLADATTQWYGLVDDLAFYDFAMGPGDVATAAATTRLTGAEPGLIAGYTFDSKTPDGGALPAVLARPVTFETLAAPVLVPAFKVAVSQARLDANDAPVMLKPQLPVSRRLPFEPGTAWFVLQGNDTPDSSHNDSAAFCWDFVLASSTKNTLTEGTAWTTCGQHVLASATMTYQDHLDQPGGTCGCTDGDSGLGDCHDGRNFLAGFEHPFQRAAYLHLKTGSINDALGPLLNSPAIPAGAQIGAVGSRCANNCHLHVAVGETMTIPSSYVQYEVSTDGGAHWDSVAEGVPKAGQWVRNTP